MTIRSAGIGLAVLGLAVSAEARAGQNVIISGDFPVREAREMPKGDGLILGRVVEGESGTPVPGATVYLSLTNQPGPGPVLTSDDGYFVFASLPAGSFTVRASKPGWVAGAFGKRRPDEASGPDSRTIDLGDGERLGDVTIRMWKFAAIEGQVVDEAGEPMVNVPVRAMRRAIVAGRIRYEVAPGLAPGNTDDRGMFRISTLVPGDYIVVLPAITTTRAVTAVGGPASSNPSYSESTSGAGRWVGGGSLVGSRLDVGDDNYSILTGSSMNAVPGYAGRTKDGRILVYETQFYPSANRIGRAAVITLRSGEERAASTSSFALCRRRGCQERSSGRTARRANSCCASPARIWSRCRWKLRSPRRSRRPMGGSRSSACRRATTGSGSIVCRARRALPTSTT